MKISKAEQGIAESLMAVGLYNVNFEILILTIQYKFIDFLEETNPGDVNKLRGGYISAHKVITYCCPKLIELDVISSSDYEFIKEYKNKRNQIAHEAYNMVLHLEFDEQMKQDNSKVWSIVNKVYEWEFERVNTPYPPTGMSPPIAPPMFFPGFISGVAGDVCRMLKNMAQENT